MTLIKFKLGDRKVDENSFFLEPNGTKDESRKLDFTNTYGILNPFWVVIDGERKYFRYIEGCKIYDPAEQDKQKIVSNMQTSLVQFQKGSDIIIDDEMMAPLVEFLRIHPHNPESKYHKKGVHESKFHEFNPKKTIIEEYKEAEIEDAAMLLFAQVAKNKEKMASLALLFAETKDLQDEQEIYLGLREIAKTKPRSFKDSIANRENEVLSEVLKAQTGQFGIIGKDAKGFFYEEDKALIFEPTVSNKKAAEAEFVTYLMSREGDIHYRNLILKIAQKELALNSPAGEVNLFDPAKETANKLPAT